MTHRSPARWLAPLAILLCAFAVYAVVHATLGQDGQSDAATTTTATPAKSSTATTTTARGAGTGPRTYTVRSGDVLSAIAQKAGVSVDEIEKLNPGLDARALRPGQKLKLRQ